MDQKVFLELTRAEAIVLDNLLARWEELKDDDSLRFEDKSEKIVLWNIEGSLEKLLQEPFASNYLEILAKAQEEVKNT
jgi:hypothetical protein